MSAPGPDGLPVPPSGVSRVPPRPRLCEQGPCRHYHRLTIQVDAESPRAVKTPVRLPLVSDMVTEASDGGALYQAPRTFHTEVQHYCYPDTGIETTLGATPVVECNRWSPDPEADDAAERARGIFLSSRRGQRYLADLKAWEDAREAEATEAEEIERALADAEAERAGVKEFSEPVADDDAPSLAPAVGQWACPMCRHTFAPGHDAIPRSPDATACLDCDPPEADRDRVNAIMFELEELGAFQVIGTRGDSGDVRSVFAPIWRLVGDMKMESCPRDAGATTIRSWIRHELIRRARAGKLPKERKFRE